MRILFAGSGAFGLPTLTHLIAEGVEIVAIYTQPDRPAGRGKKLTPTPVAAYADAAGLPTIRTADINAESLPPADALVVIAFGQKIAPQVVDHARFGAINLHASLLPKFRGAAPIHWAVLSGESVTGNSVIRLAERMDAGAILGQSAMPIGELDTTGELHDRLAAAGGELVARVLGELRIGIETETQQDESRASPAPKLTRETAALDFTRPAGVVCRTIHGLYPWPGCRVRLIDAKERETVRLTLVRARVVEKTRSGFVGILDDAGHVGCGEGMIEIVELQPEGKRPMPLASFRNGHPWQAEMRLESIV